MIRKIPQQKINVLLIDGECLLKQGFHGTKQVQTKNGSVGTIFHFINTIRSFYTDFGITKVIVFWEGENSKLYRQSHYPHYKANREDKYDGDEEYDLDRQRCRIQSYLEELFIRQVSVHGCEADDSIAYYVKHSPNEAKIILTNDRDFLQLISEDTKIYLTNLKAVITQKNFHSYFDYHYSNVGIIKMIAGDKSDNISGLKGIGESTVLNIFPELKLECKSHQWVIDRVKDLLIEDPKNKKLNIIKDGVTKWGDYGEEYFNIMNIIINLNEPHITEELVDIIDETVIEPLLPDGRGGINEIMKMMRDDELLFKIPRYDDGFVTFWNPFMIIISKEKKIYENYKKTVN